MCGIYANSRTGDDIVKLKNKLTKQNHRGPDYSKVKLINDKVIFGHNRLSIIDLDERANQPMQYAENWITFNGEIYNFIELKEELLKNDYYFKTTSDTEVLLASYDFWGESFVSKLEGMFAFVIYDSKNNLLFGARDRLGQKPFFYCIEEGHIEIASLGSLVKSSKNSGINELAQEKYLLWGYVPEPLSIYIDVNKLPAGHTIKYFLSENKVSVKRYWDVNYEETGNYQGSFSEAKQELDSLLTKSVKDRMMADVPIGVFLSGGIDSSIITAIAQKVTNTKVKTFSIKFEEDGFDESKYAKQVAAFLKTEHTEITCTYEEAKELIYNFSYYYDEPFDDSSAIPSMLLAKHTRKDVTVALTGDAGDENFIGYGRYFKTRTYSKYVKEYPKVLRPLSIRILQFIKSNTAKNLSNWMEFDNLKDFYLYQMTGGEKKWLKFDSKNIDNRYDEIWFNSKLNDIEKVALFDLKTYLIDDINAKVDQASMAYSLETRSPLLNFNIVEYANKLPFKYKVSPSQEGKYILKELLYDYIPKEMFDRKKAGFAMPLKDWFRDELKDYVYEVLSDNNLKKISNIKFEVVKSMIEEHMDNTVDNSRILWRLICLIKWMDKHE